MPEFIDRSEGRRLFGLNPEGYEDARPPYPEMLYQVLIEQGALTRGSATLEIGAGSGLATRRLIELGAGPITVVEPDERFVPQLSKLRQTTGADLRVLSCAFEDAQLPSHSFGLVAAATSYHWLDPDIALVKIADALAPGGYVALWWNVFTDLDREDPFHDATLPLFGDQAISPSGAPDAIPFALDRAAREVGVRAQWRVRAGDLFRNPLDAGARYRASGTPVRRVLAHSAVAATRARCVVATSDGSRANTVRRASRTQYDVADLSREAQTLLESPLAVEPSWEHFE